MTGTPKGKGPVRRHENRIRRRGLFLAAARFMALTGARGIGRPIERRIVDDDRDSVRTQVNIQLESVQRPFGRAMEKGLHRVLREHALRHL
jgi:hypothetical protein